MDFDFLPLYSPDLNPIERVWKLTRQRRLHNVYFAKRRVAAPPTCRHGNAGRIEELAEKCTKGRLMPEERDEYEALIRVGNFVVILQAKARRLLAEGHAAAYHVEHIVARQHGGRHDSGNLALACYHCNAYKGPNLSGLDPESSALVRCFIRGRTSGMSTSGATQPYCWAHCGRTSDGRLVEDERSGSPPASRTVAFLGMENREGL
jgi:HNH endonuclease